MAYRIKGVVRIDDFANASLGIVTATEFVGKISSEAITAQTEGSESDISGADELLIYDNATGQLLRVDVDEFIGGSGIGTIVTDFDNLNVSGVTTTATLKGVGNGTISVGSSLSVGDNVEIILGDDGDFKIYHDGDNTYLDEIGQGNLKVRTNNLRVTNITETKTIFSANAAQGVTLAFNGNNKLETTNEGAIVTGILTATSFSGDGSGLTNLNGKVDAWATVDQTTTQGPCNVPGSYNIASVTRRPVPGLYDVVFSSPMPSADYAVLVNASGNSTLQSPAAQAPQTSKTVTGFQVLILDPADGTTTADAAFSFSVNATNAQLPNTFTESQIQSVVDLAQNLSSLSVFADNAAAKAGGLSDGDIYRQSDGTLMVVFT